MNDGTVPSTRRKWTKEDYRVAKREQKKNRNPKNLEYTTEDTLLQLAVSRPVMTELGIKAEHSVINADMTRPVLHVRFIRDGGIVAHWYPSRSSLHLGDKVRRANKLVGEYPTVETVLDELNLRCGPFLV